MNKNYQINSLWYTELEAKAIAKPDTKVLVYEEFSIYEEVAGTIWNLNETT